MKRALALCLALALCMGLALPAAAQWQPPAEPQSAAVYLINLDTGTVVYEKAAHERRAIASLTKMMTALLLLESGEDLAAQVTIPERLATEFDKIQQENGSDADLKIGETLTLEDLLYCILLPSANDAASVVADYLSGGDLEAFAEAMTQRAAQLGCEDTQFSCAHGLYGQGNWSTAYDMALIAQACAAQPMYMQAATATEHWLPVTEQHTQPKSAEVPPGMSRLLRSTNVLQDPEQELYRAYIRGMKTGFTDEAGRCFASTAQYNGQTWLLVVLGAPIPLAEDGFNQAFHDTVELYDWALQKFVVGQAPATGEPVAVAPIRWCAGAAFAELYAAAPVTALLEADAPPEYQVQLAQPALQAPLQGGQAVGTAAVFVDGQQVGQVQLVAGQNYPRSAWLYYKDQLWPHRWALAAGGAAVLALAVLAARRARKRRRPRLVVYQG